MTPRSRPQAREGPERSESTFSIAGLSARSGVTAEAIRWYEREGVIPKARRAGPGPYRTFDHLDVQRLTFIREARNFGFSLDAIRALLTLSAESVRAKRSTRTPARDLLASLDAKTTQLVRLRAALEHHLENPESQDARRSIIISLGSDDAFPQS